MRAEDLYLVGRAKDAIVGQTETAAFFWDGEHWRLLRRSVRVELGPWDGQRLRVLYGDDYPWAALYDLSGPRFTETVLIDADLGEADLAYGAINGGADDFTLGLHLPGLDPSTMRLVRYEAGAFHATVDVPGQFIAVTPGQSRVVVVEAVPSEAYAFGRVRAVDPKTNAVEVLLEPVGQRLECPVGSPTTCVERDLAVFGSLSADGARFAAVAFDERDGRGRVYAKVVSLPFSGPLFGPGTEPVDPPDAGGPGPGSDGGGPGPGPDAGAPNAVTLVGQFEVSNGENERLQVALEPTDGFGKATVLQVWPEFRAEVDAMRPYRLKLTAEGYQPLEFETFIPPQAGATFESRIPVLVPGRASRPVARGRAGLRREHPRRDAHRGRGHLEAGQRRRPGRARGPGHGARRCHAGRRAALHARRRAGAPARRKPSSGPSGSRTARCWGPSSPTTPTSTRSRSSRGRARWASPPTAPGEGSPSPGARPGSPRCARWGAPTSPTACRRAGAGRCCSTARPSSRWSSWRPAPRPRWAPTCRPERARRSPAPKTAAWCWSRKGPRHSAGRIAAAAG
ncbi:MAG: hypothetical protein QM765_35460 [Myxococcales bacterium]